MVLLLLRLQYQKLSEYFLLLWLHTIHVPHTTCSLSVTGACCCGPCPLSSLSSAIHGQAGALSRYSRAQGTTHPICHESWLDSLLAACSSSRAASTLRLRRKSVTALVFYFLFHFIDAHSLCCDAPEKNVADLDFIVLLPFVLYSSIGVLCSRECARK